MNEGEEGIEPLDLDNAGEYPLNTLGTLYIDPQHIMNQGQTREGHTSSSNTPSSSKTTSTPNYSPREESEGLENKGASESPTTSMKHRTSFPTSPRSISSTTSNTISSMLKSARRRSMVRSSSFRTAGSSSKDKRAVTFMDEVEYFSGYLDQYAIAESSSSAISFFQFFQLLWRLSVVHLIWIAVEAFVCAMIVIIIIFLLSLITYTRNSFTAIVTILLGPIFVIAGSGFTLSLMSYEPAVCLKKLKSLMLIAYEGEWGIENKGEKRALIKKKLGL
eukprot:TRINITY_DN7049_c0_g1_i5.p1 TRINITY_DN7049_c0_g1~~TRINITY_DN7049_c0_g1_i5.p1  ORF type:complete len:276 (-),score=15.90 TRINITY_DN7049_c0_g1_i5:904-1731(-)